MVAPTFVLKRIASGLSALALVNLVMMIQPTMGEESADGVCQEVEAGSDEYKYYSSRSKGFHTIPVFKDAINGPAWKALSVKSVNDMVLTINTPDSANYAVIMDTKDHSEANLAHNIVIKMANKGKNHFFYMVDFVTCTIARQDPKETPEWAYLVEHYSSTG